MADDRKLLEILVANLRVWESEQEDEVVLPEIVDQVEEYLFGEVEPPPILPNLKPKTNPGRAITSLKTLRDWWVMADGQYRLEQWIESKNIHDLKRFCKQEKITIIGPKTRDVLVYAVKNAVSGPRISGFETRRRRRMGE